MVESFLWQFVFQLIYFTHDKASLQNEKPKKVQLNMAIQDQPNPVYSLFCHTNFKLSLFDKVKHLSISTDNATWKMIVYNVFYTKNWALIRRLNFMRSKFTFSWGQNYFCSWGWICSLIFDSIDQEVDTSKSIISNFDLMIDLLVASTIMRLKFKINY